MKTPNHQIPPLLQRFKNLGMESEPPEENEEEEETLHHTSDENNELQQLEEDVKLMAQKIAEFRHILRDQLHNTLASILSAQRPTDNHPGPSTTHNSGILTETLC